jgi:hypothetical protein
MTSSFQTRLFQNAPSIPIFEASGTPQRCPFDVSAGLDGELLWIFRERLGWLLQGTHPQVERANKNSFGESLGRILYSLSINHRAKLKRLHCSVGV